MAPWDRISKYKIDKLQMSLFIENFPFSSDSGLAHLIAIGGDSVFV